MYYGSSDSLATSSGCRDWAGELTHDRVGHLLRLIGGSGGRGEGAEDWRKEAGSYETEDTEGARLDRLVMGVYSGLLMLRFRLDGLGGDGRSRNVLTGLDHMLKQLK